jgi:hypothetical protein
MLGSRLCEIELERDEWRKRAEAAATRRPVREHVVKRGSRRVRALTASWLVTIGLLVGGAAIPRANDAPTLREDYPACIGKARYEHPIQGNQYQELVNALYTCDVYGME